jgi:hypothetical protein
MAKLLTWATDQILKVKHRIHLRRFKFVGQQSQKPLFQTTYSVSTNCQLNSTTKSCPRHRRPSDRSCWFGVRNANGTNQSGCKSCGASVVPVLHGCNSVSFIRINCYFKCNNLMEFWIQVCIPTFLGPTNPSLCKLTESHGW